MFSSRQLCSGNPKKILAVGLPNDRSSDVSLGTCLRGVSTKTFHIKIGRIDQHPIKIAPIEWFIPVVGLELAMSVV